MKSRRLTTRLHRDRQMSDWRQLSEEEYWKRSGTSHEQYEQLTRHPFETLTEDAEPPFALVLTKDLLQLIPGATRLTEELEDELADYEGTTGSPARLFFVRSGRYSVTVDDILEASDG